MNSLARMHQLSVNAELVGQIVAIARDAGNAILEIYRHIGRSHDARAGIQCEDKPDGSPLTQADLTAHALISQRLATLTPHTPVVSEEDDSSMSHRRPAGQFWLVDPLDGTKEFLAQTGDFTVNIALVQDGCAVLGVVVAPALDQTYWGASDMGAFRQSKGITEQIHVSPSSRGGNVRVLGSKSHMTPQTLDFIQGLGTHELIQAGSSLKFCRIAEGAADVYPRLGPTCEWDTAAAQAILEAAGGQVLQLDGTPLRYGKPDVLNPYFVATSCPLDPSLFSSVRP